MKVINESIYFTPWDDCLPAWTIIKSDIQYFSDYQNVFFS